MSNDDFPQPPKLSSPSDLRAGKNSIFKPLTAKKDEAPTTSHGLRSVVPSVPTIPSKNPEPETVAAAPAVADEEPTPPASSPAPEGPAQALPAAEETPAVEELFESTVAADLPADESAEPQAVEAAVDEFEEILTNEESAATEGTEEEPAAADEEVAEETPAEADPDATYGPWAIIKHTGLVTTAVWAVLTALVSGATAYFFTPGHFTWIAIAVLGFMMGVIAAVDRKTHRIKNQHTILTAAAAVPLAALAAFTISPWNILFGIIAAVLIFIVFFLLVIFVGFGSGGDIKFSPIPAFVLGIVTPLMSAIWLFLALIITVVLLVFSKKKKTSFGEGMAISLPLAILAVYGLYSLIGMPYMH